MQVTRKTVAVGLGSLILCLVFLVYAGYGDQRYQSQLPIKPLPPVAAFAKRWIVITTIQGPTDAVLRFAGLKDWQLLVIGDKKTPAQWTCPGVIFLNLKQQEALGYSILSLVPRNSYARKNIGYLYAIQHGAEDL